ncbi:MULTISPECIES: hypothetical protein [Pseudomonas]|jgi:hypothetical protein|uniref:hypothetical protein n=1 Tax=Pseudomonas TaxID=286 RepID=UPI00068BD9E1|nr:MULTISPECIES: hypothetical protein [Pseudomonas]EIU1414797.1 hypothetical protein [Pseudomonas aeruginosa]EKT4450900.1 hypothetical protein [Pseudomonas putida]MBC9053131.1 hypothetical protein [Pseudomonas aeruginosa]MBW6313719.1 hypothetical protein [Pseudomonas aeruginosa]MCA4075021.1 hypothetical protein [Pseudomonas kurunegalensis]
MENLLWKRLETRPARQSGLGIDPTSKRVLMPGHALFLVRVVAMELTQEAQVSRNNRSFPAIVLSPGVWQFIAEVGTATDAVAQSEQRLQAVLGIALASVDHQLRQSRELLLDHASQRDSRSSTTATQFQVTHITPETGPVFLHIRLPHEIGVDISSA